MIVICAWCKRKLRDKPPHDGFVLEGTDKGTPYAEIKTHGICEPCKRGLMEDIRENAERKGVM